MSTIETTTTTKVTVWLSQDFRETCCGYDPDRQVTYEPLGFELESTGAVEADLELAFALCNSTPGEIFAPVTERHVRIVEFYRSHGARSLSVGDLVTVDGQTFACASFDWEPVPGFDVNAGSDAWEAVLAARCSDPDCRLAH